MGDCAIAGPREPAKMAENDTAETCPFRSITTLYDIVNNSSNLTSNISRKAQTLYFPLPKLEVKDEITEEQHVRDGIVLIIIIFLLFITIITIWIFKAKRIRVCHETGLAMIYGKRLNRFVFVCLLMCVSRSQTTPLNFLWRVWLRKTDVFVHVCVHVYVCVYMWVTP